jgi:hypothetical protein
MRDRTKQRGQALAYFGICTVAFFALAAVAVDAGRHVFVGREAQAVADATALAGATALARGADAATAVTAATSFAPEDTVDGQAASVDVSNVQVGNWDGSAFTLGGLPLNAVLTTPSFTFNNIFGLWSATSVTKRTAVAASQGLPQLPIALCGTVNWTSGVTLRFSTSNGTDHGHTAAWAVYDPQLTSFPGMSTVKQYLPKGCGGDGWIPPPQTVGERVSISNGTLSNEVCTGFTQPSCTMVGQTYLVPIVDADCYVNLNGSHKITGFVTAKITAVDCNNTPRSLTGETADTCATTPSATLCPSAALVR